MADNEASIGIRAYLIDELSSAMQAITEGFMDFEAAAENATATTAEAMGDLQKAEEAVVTESEAVAEALDTAVTSMETQVKATEGLRLTMDDLTSTMEEYFSVLLKLGEDTAEDATAQGELRDGIDEVTASMKGLITGADSFKALGEAAFQAIKDLAEGASTTKEFEDSILAIVTALQSMIDTSGRATAAQESLYGELMGTLAAYAGVRDSIKATEEVVDGLNVVIGTLIEKEEEVTQQTKTTGLSLDELFTIFSGGTMATKEYGIALVALMEASKQAAAAQVDVATAVSEADAVAGPLRIKIDTLTDSFDALAESAAALKIIAENEQLITDSTDQMAEALLQAGTNTKAFTAIDDALNLAIEGLRNGTMAADEFKAALDSISNGAQNYGAQAATAASANNQLGTAHKNAGEDALGQLFALQMLQQTLQQVSTTITGAASTMISSAGDEEEAFIRMNNALHLTGASATAMGDSVVQTANTSTFSAEEIAQAFTLMGEKGYTSTEIIKGMGTALINLAEATGTDITPATDLLITTMRTFGAQASEASKYADMLTYSFQHGIPDAAQLQEAIVNVGSTAAALKIPFDQVGATLDWLANNGLTNASTAGTSLRYILTSMSSPTTKTATELANLGIIGIDPTNAKLKDLVTTLNGAQSTQFGLSGSVQNLTAVYAAAQKLGLIPESQTFMEWGTSIGAVTDSLYSKSGELKSLPDVISNIVTAVEKLPKGEAQNDALANLFNIKSGQAAKIFANAKDIKGQLLKIIQGEDGSTKGKGDAATQAEKLQASFNVKVAELKTSWQSFIAEVGMPIITGLKPIIDDLNKMVGAMSKSHSPWLKFAAIALLILAVLVPIAVFILGIVVVFTLLGAAGAALVPIIGIVAAVILGLALGAAALITWWKPISGFFIGLWHAISSGTMAGVNAVTSTISAWAGNIGHWFQQAGAAISGAWNGAVKGVQNGFNAVINWTGAFGASFNKAVSTAFNGAVNGVKSFGVGIANGAQAAWKATLSGLSSFGAMLLNGVKAAWNYVVNYVKGIGASFMKAMSWLYNHNYYVQDIVDGIRLTWAAITGGIKAFAAWASAFLKGMWAGISSAASTAWKGVSGAVSTAWTAITGGIKTAGAAIVGATTYLWNAVSGAVHTAWSAITSAVNAGASWVANFVKAIWGGVSSATVGAWNAVSGAVHSAWNSITGAVSYGVAAVLNFLTPGVNTVKSVSNSAWNSVTDGVHTAWSNITGAVNTGIASVMGVVNGLGSQLYNAGATAIKMMGDGIKSAIGGLGDAAQGAGAAIWKVLGFHSPPKEGILSDSDQYMPNMMKMMSSGITSNKHLVTTAVGDVALGIHTGLNSPVVASLKATYGAGSGGGGAGGNNHTYNVAVQVDGKTMTTVVMKNIAGDLKMNQMSAQWR